MTYAVACIFGTVAIHLFNLWNFALFVPGILLVYGVTLGNVFLVVLTLGASRAASCLACR